MLSVIAHLVLYRGNAKQHKIISVILFAQWNYNYICFIMTSNFSALNEPSISPPSRLKENHRGMKVGQGKSMLKSPLDIPKSLDS